MTATTAARLRLQHRLVAEFSIAGLRMSSFDAVVNEACRVAAEGLSVKLAKAMRHEDRHLLFVAAVGWKEEDRKRIVFPVDESNPAGFAFLARRPVISNHLDVETRFRTPGVFARYGITRTLNIPVRGLSDYYGILEADAQGGEEFVETDIVFLEAIANIVSLTRERLELLGDGPSDAYLLSIHSSTTDCIVVVSSDGRVEYLNENALSELQTKELGELRGTSIEALFEEAYRQSIRHALTLATGGQPGRLEVARQDGARNRRWWDISFTPLTPEDSAGQRVACSMRDITARHDHEQALSELIRSQEERIDSSSLQVREVHHRVRNSLQLVHNLLGMQATVSQEPEVKGQLLTAATRVRTIAAVHEMLYQAEDGAQIDARHFLEGLAAELQTLSPGREVRAEVQDALAIGSHRMSGLGMVVAELVTNALKYGEGPIIVKLASVDDEDLMLAVSDSGPGFPSDFPASRGSGLGMRLIRTYSGRGQDAIEIDRSVPFSRICVRFRRA